MLVQTYENFISKWIQNKFSKGFFSYHCTQIKDLSYVYIICLCYRYVYVDHHKNIENKLTEPHRLKTDSELSRSRIVIQMFTSRGQSYKTQQWWLNTFFALMI